jgi:limonene-1,2-epoxide hydrolase
VDELVSYFDDDAVWIDGPRGVHRGVDAITAALEADIAMGFPSVFTIEVKSLVAEDGTVMMERVDSFSMAGKPFSMDQEILGLQRRHIDLKTARLPRPKLS